MRLRPATYTMPLPPVKTLRTAYGTQAEAAAALGLNPRTLRRAEKNPDPDAVRVYQYALAGLLTSEGIALPLAKPPPVG